MCASSQSCSVTKHFLLSAYGSKWSERYLAMYTIYIDDSGSDRSQKVVVACGLVIAAVQIVRMEKEWNSFLEKEGITEFHTSECLARNPKSEFAAWDEERVARVFARVGQMTIKFASRAFCILIHKDLYDEVMPLEMRERVGSYYTWALSSLLGMGDDFSKKYDVPMEYVFDNADNKTKREVDEAVEYADLRFPGQYSFAGHYSFRNRKDIPTLQAADFFAWNCFQQGRRARLGSTIHPLAAETYEAFAKAKGGEWVDVQSLNREGIERWVKEKYKSPEDEELKKFKEDAKASRMSIPKQKKNLPPTKPT